MLRTSKTGLMSDEPYNSEWSIYFSLLRLFHLDVIDPAMNLIYGVFVFVEEFTKFVSFISETDVVPLREDGRN